MRYIQKSFSRGILSPNVLTRENIPGYDESARDLYNVLIDRQGVAYKRGGTNLLAQLPKEIFRIVPFKDHDDTYLICFSSGNISDDVSDDLVDTENIYILNLSNLDISKKPVNFDEDDFDFHSSVKVLGRGVERNIRALRSYWRSISEGFTADELRSFDYTQIENIMVFCSESFPPFYIRKEERGFVYYRNAMDIIRNGNKEDDTGDLKKSIRTLPFSYYGYGLSLTRTSVDRTRKNVRFTGYLTLSGTHDARGLDENNIDLWKNRSFVVSTSGEDGLSINVFNGIIHEIKVNSSSRGNPSRYQVKGVLHTERDADINRADFIGESNLYLCDWSERLGWPRSVSIFENRIIFFSNDAYPSKVWYSAQPGIQRVNVGTKTEVSPESDLSVETRTVNNVYKTLYFDQFDLFNLDVIVTGLLPQQASSAGSVFINDNRGYTGYWVRGGENICYFGTNLGIFTTQGTLTDRGNPIPFNSGFKLFNHPAKRVFPITVDENLYFISEDNSVQKLAASDERRSLVTESLDSFSKEVIRDVTTRTMKSRALTVQDLVETDISSEKTLPAKRSLNIDMSPSKVNGFTDSDQSQDYDLESIMFFIKEQDIEIDFQDQFLFQSVMSPFSRAYRLVNNSTSNPESKVNALAKKIYESARDMSGETAHAYTTDFMPIGFVIGTEKSQTHGGDDFVDVQLRVSFLKRASVLNADLPSTVYSRGQVGSVSLVTLPAIGEELDTSEIEYQWSGSTVETDGFTLSSAPTLNSQGDYDLTGSRGENLFNAVGGDLDDDDLELDGNINITTGWQLRVLDFTWRRSWYEFDDIWDNEIWLIGAASEAEISLGNFVAWKLEEGDDNNETRDNLEPVYRHRNLTDISSLRYFRTTLSTLR